MMFIQKMFRVTPLFCAAVAAVATAQAQDQRPRGLVGSVNGGVYTSPTGAFSIEVPVLSSLGGAVSDTPKVVIFQDNFGLQVSLCPGRDAEMGALHARDQGLSDLFPEHLCAVGFPQVLP
jgi:hypothetical protein